VSSYAAFYLRELKSAITVANASTASSLRHFLLLPAFDAINTERFLLGNSTPLTSPLCRSWRKSLADPYNQSPLSHRLPDAHPAFHGHRRCQKGTRCCEPTSCDVWPHSPKDCDSSNCCIAAGIWIPVIRQYIYSVYSGATAKQYWVQERGPAISIPF
jgi:hypothetical protein